MLCSECQQPGSFSNCQRKKPASLRKCLACSAELSFEVKSKQLSTWLTLHESVSKVTLVHENNFRSLHCNQKLMSSQTCLFIPRKCMMLLSNAQELKGFDLGSVSSQSILATYLLSEIRKGPESFYAGYIGLLPKHYQFMPLYFTIEKLKRLAGSHTIGMISAQCSSIAQDFQKLGLEVAGFSLNTFIWARLAVLTRTFKCKIDNVAQECLVPVADMINHGAEPNLAWEFDDRAQGFIMKTTRAIAENAPLVDSYGSKCNSRFFVNYGFTLPNNEHANQAALFFDVGHDIMGKRNFDNDFSGYTVVPNMPFRFQVTAIVAKIGVLDQMLIQAMFGLLRGICAKLSYVGILQTGFVSEQNELQVLDTISKSATSHMAEYVANDTDEHNIRQLIDGEKEVLQYYIDLHEFVKSKDLTKVGRNLKKHERFKFYYDLLWQKPNTNTIVL